MEQVIRAIAEKIGFRVSGLQVVSGGDMSRSYCVSIDKGKLMLKLNDATKYPGMFEKETEGLQALAKAGKLKIPAAVAAGHHDNLQYLWLEWMDSGTPPPDFWDELAVGIGMIHDETNPQFGWHGNNYIGALVQSNEWQESWSLFYATRRIMPLVKVLYNSKVFDNADLKDAEAVCKRLPGLFPEEPPALLHGDLWSGNFLAVVGAEAKVVPALFDPAVYFGHHEMDLGMSLLFGGFHSRFYECYESNFRLEKQWRTRVSLTQLYPLLVHAVLFGGSYISRCKSILQQWR
ncbi:fructosamine kinase family protein [Segetibacter sp. 3557_3]|uniref:fructosamine kinase family protein n=1 Tax=Segetibacter sp. 3557_3 TaxID=2547429 RepID=UPI0014047903|nr:fructosamine kinase family protein [Segetibacter sp. 3557_3]